MVKRVSSRGTKPKQTQHSQETNIHPCLRWDSNPCERPQTYALDRAATWTG